MSRQQFTARNNIGSVLTFQKSGTTASFDPTITFSSGSRRVSWKLNNGTNTTQTAGNSIIYTGFTSDPEIRTIEMRGNSFRGITQLSLDNENLYGHIDLSGLNNWGSFGTLQLFANPNLTGITNPSITSTQLNHYQIQSTGFVGNLNMTPITANISSFLVNNNPTLTGITHNTTSRVIGQYVAHTCNLTGNLNLPFTGLGGSFQVYSNSGLTSVNFTTSTQNITILDVFNCNLSGTLDLSPLTKLGGSSSGITLSIVRLQNNPNLTNIIFPNSTQFFKNYLNSEGNGVFDLYNCNLDYVDFTPLSGATLLSGTTQGIPRISLRDNNMSAADVNHILVDFSGNTTYNPTGWSNVNLNIGGTNDPPDSTSGGYNGLAAISFLTGSPYNWIITT